MLLWKWLYLPLLNASCRPPPCLHPGHSEGLSSHILWKCCSSASIQVKTGCLAQPAQDNTALERRVVSGGQEQDLINRGAPRRPWGPAGSGHCSRAPHPPHCQGDREASDRPEGHVAPGSASRFFGADCKGVPILSDLVPMVFGIVLVLFVQKENSQIYISRRQRRHQHQLIKMTIN